MLFDLLVVQQSSETQSSACESVKDIIETLNTKGFMWCLIHQDKIDNAISAAQAKIADVFNMFNVSSYLLWTIGQI